LYVLGKYPFSFGGVSTVNERQVAASMQVEVCFHANKLFGYSGQEFSQQRLEVES